MNTNLFFGGAQSPMTRSLLRTASIFSFTDFTNPHVFSSLNDIDSPGLRDGPRPNSYLTTNKKIIPVEALEAWSRTEKSEWLPVNWKYPFHQKGSDTHYLVNTGYPQNITIKGLPFSEKLKEAVVFASMWEVDCVIEILTHPTFRERFSASYSTEVMERAVKLKKFILKTAKNSTSLQEFWQKLARFMLGDRIESLEMDSLSDFFSLSDQTCHEDKFWLLNRFLKNPKKNLDLYREFKPTQGNEIPFWFLCEENGFFVRKKITRKNGGRIYVDNEKSLGHGIKDTYQLAEALKLAEFANASIVPKVFLLIPTFRFIGTHYCSDPNYLADVMQFTRRIGMEQSPILSIKHDMSKSVPAYLWTIFVQFFKTRSSLDGAELNRAVNDWKFNPTLTFLWLWGEEVLTKTIEGAQKRWVE